MRVGLAFQSDKAPDAYARLARLAESYGVDVLSVFGDLTYQPPLMPLLEMARATSRVQLGAACWNPYSMHPYEIAGQVAALDLVSGGRAYVGLARGSWLDGIGLQQPRPLAHLREAVEVIYRLLGTDDTGFDGEIFQLAKGMRLRYEIERPRPPLLIGTWGERTAAYAAGVADEVKVGGTANPAVIWRMRERLPDHVGLVAGAVTVVDEDGEAARARARAEVALYLPVVSRLDPTVKTVDPDLFTYAGTPEQVAERAQAVLDAGATRIEFGTPHGLTDERGVELLGAEVIPRLR